MLCTLVLEPIIIIVLSISTLPVIKLAILNIYELFKGIENHINLLSMNKLLILFILIRTSTISLTKSNMKRTLGQSKIFLDHFFACLQIYIVDTQISNTLANYYDISTVCSMIALSQWDHNNFSLVMFHFVLYL